MQIRQLDPWDFSQCLIPWFPQIFHPFSLIILLYVLLLDLYCFLKIVFRLDGTYYGRVFVSDGPFQGILSRIKHQCY